MNELLNTTFLFGHHAFTVLDIVEVVAVVFFARLVLALLRRALRRAERFSTLVEQLLCDAIAEQPEILAKPEPTVFF